MAEEYREDGIFVSAYVPVSVYGRVRSVSLGDSLNKAL